MMDSTNITEMDSDMGAWNSVKNKRVKEGRLAKFSVRSSSTVRIARTSSGDSFPPFSESTIRDLRDHGYQLMLRLAIPADISRRRARDERRGRGPREGWDEHQLAGTKRSISVVFEIAKRGSGIVLFPKTERVGKA